LAPLCAKGVVNSFLEVGCGIGTRLIMVDRMFGIPAVGFDRNPDYIQIANSYVNQFNARRVIVHTQDAFDYQLYNEFDCVFLNKPIWDRTLEIALEDYVYNSVKPGSIFLAGQTITQPPWEIIAEATALAVYKVTSERRHSSILQT
jgi:SAM-dependent methyltransferase